MELMLQCCIKAAASCPGCVTVAVFREHGGNSKGDGVDPLISTAVRAVSAVLRKSLPY